MSAEKALYKYMSKQAKQSLRDMKPKRRNKKPENAAQADIVKRGRRDGFELYITDSSAKWNSEAQAYVSDVFEKGMSDLTGDKDAVPCYVEVKAPGKRSTLKEHQRQFLIRKINRGCFVCCSDRYEHLIKLWNKWRLSGKDSKILMADLPASKIKDDKGPLFD